MMYFRHIALASLFLLGACGGGSSGSNDEQRADSTPAANTSPIANAGNDQSVDIETYISLDGSNSVDSDGDNLSFQWTVKQEPNGSNVRLNGGTTSSPSFITDSFGEYIIELTVFDGKEYSLVDEVTVTVMQQLLNCNNLDPNKIYLLGTLQKNGKIHGIADPTDPSDFCVGFSREHYAGEITYSGQMVVATEDYTTKNFYSFSPDELAKDENGIWVYPSEPHSNDRLIHTVDMSGCGLLSIKVPANTEDILYSCPNRVFHTRTKENYYDIGSTSGNEILAAFSDGSFLAITSEKGLIFVDAQLNETAINLPFATDFTYFYGARQYTDTQTKNKSIWLAVFPQNGSVESLKRISIDLTNFEVSDDGSFALPPEGFKTILSQIKLDLEGSLWEIGYQEDDPTNMMVVKRPIDSSDLSYKVIYQESDYSDQEVYIGLLPLCEDVEPWEECHNGEYNWNEHENLFLKIDGASQLITGS